MPTPDPNLRDAPAGRRDLLKKLAVGSAAVWVAPAIVSAPVAAQQGSGTLTAVPECPSQDSFAFLLTAPASYVGTGFYYAFDITATTPFDSCGSGLATLYPINVSSLPYTFVGFGLFGTADIWIHNGDCVPIESVTGVTFDCRLAGAPADGRSRSGTLTTRSETGEITVTNP